jgi:hypothetical protein
MLHAVAAFDLALSVQFFFGSQHLRGNLGQAIDMPQEVSYFAFAKLFQQALIAFQRRRHDCVMGGEPVSGQAHQNFPVIPGVDRPGTA